MTKTFKTYNDPLSGETIAIVEDTTLGWCSPSNPQYIEWLEQGNTPEEYIPPA